MIVGIARAVEAESHHRRDLVFDPHVEIVAPEPQPRQHRRRQHRAHCPAAAALGAQLRRTIEHAGDADAGWNIVVEEAIGCRDVARQAGVDHGLAAVGKPGRSMCPLPDLS